jgi:hypothetical protein
MLSDIKKYRELKNNALYKHESDIDTEEKRLQNPK